MPLDYRKTGADSGYNILDSVQPVSNAESADEDVFRRPSENLRNRTEAVRAVVDEALAEISSDRGLALVSNSADATITWGGPMPSGTGVFTLAVGTDMRVIPLLSPSTGSAKNDIWGRRRLTFGGTKYFTVRSKLRVSEGGNNIITEIFSVNGTVFGGGTAVNVTIEGSKNPSSLYDPLYGPVKVRIQLSKTGGAIQSRWSDVLTGITGNTYSNDWLSAAVTAGEESTLATECTSGFFWESGGAGWSSVSGCDAQGYRVTAAELSAFLTSHKLYEGDSLFIKFATAQARLDQAGNVTVGNSLLKRIHREEGTEPPTTLSDSDSVNLMHCVPLCHVDNDNLIFINGTTIPTDGTGTLAPDNTLRSELASEGDGSGTGTSGAELIGIDRQPGTKTPHNLTQDNLYNQMGEFLDIVNNHYKALADQHNYAHLLNRPSYYVSPVAGEGNFETLSAALNDATIRANGGIIILKSGATFIGNTVLGAALTDHVIVIGQNTTITNSGTGILLDLGAWTFTQLKFYGIYFEQNYTQQIVNTTAVPGGPERFLAFEDCYFANEGASSTTEMIRTYGNLELYRCYFHDADYAYGRVAIKQALTADQVESRLVIKNCTFVNCGAVFDRTTGTSFRGGSLVIEDCFLESCGYSSSGSSIGRLINTSSGGFEQASICRNRVRGSAATANSALFAAVSNTGGIVADNMVLQGCLQVPSGASNALDASGRTTAGFEGRIYVRNNTIHPGKARGVVITNCDFTNNYIRDFDGPAGTYAINCNGAGIRAVGNTIERASAAANAVRGIYVGSSDCVIDGNNIDFETGVEGDLNHYGIYIAGTKAVITNNTITMDDQGSVGIHVGAADGRVTGNYIWNVQYGIANAAADTTIMGNEIHLPNPGVNASQGIYVGGGGRVIGNHIFYVSNTAGTPTGVYIDGSNTVVQGNVIENVWKGIYGGSIGNCISGNTICLNACTISGPCGIDLKAATRFACSGNTIRTLDVDDTNGIDVARGTLTEIDGSITGNTIVSAGITAGDTIGIDLTYCDMIAVSGNSIWPYLGFAIPIETTNGGAHLGLGRNLSSQNTGTHNLFDEAI